jgi:hypothetical protein
MAFGDLWGEEAGHSTWNFCVLEALGCAAVT